jgi:hypothetical protein
VPRANNAAASTPTAPQAGAATAPYASPVGPQQAPAPMGNNPNSWSNASGAPSPGTGNPPKQDHLPPK